MLHPRSVVPAIAALLVTPLWGHHSAAAEYDASKLLVLTGAWDEVGTPCRQWLRLNPGSAEARKTWIEYLIRTGNTADARTEFSRLEALRPADPESLKAWFADLNKKKPKK